MGCGKGDYCDHGLGRVGGQVLTSQDEGAGPVNGGVSPPRRTFLRRSRVSFSSDLRRSAPVSVAVGVSRERCGGLRARGRVSDRQLPQRVCRPGLPEPLEPARERIACGVRRSLGGRPEAPLGSGEVDPHHLRLPASLGAGKALSAGGSTSPPGASGPRGSGTVGGLAKGWGYSARASNTWAWSVWR